MSGRYYISGCQLGILMSGIEEKEKMRILQQVMDYQFIGNTGDKIVDNLLKELGGEK
jgi:hypothetical protein